MALHKGGLYILGVGALAYVAAYLLAFTLTLSYIARHRERLGLRWRTPTWSVTDQQGRRLLCAPLLKLVRGCWGDPGVESVEREPHRSAHYLRTMLDPRELVRALRRCGETP